ncbi:MAG: hypothetical protein WCE75_04355 [Terracidiphilus sp.]
MNYYDLCSILCSKKNKFSMGEPLPSFRVYDSPMPTYIEPTLTKAGDLFEVERPTFLLVSAVGASGKTMLARRLSVDSGLPVLDLGLHPPVGDKTLTGLLTDCFDPSVMTALFSSMRQGEFGIIIDGLDEGRSKSGEKAFEAFLEDLIKRSQGADRTTYVMLGRTKTVEDCWLYLAERCSSVGLASLDPFSIDRARDYIDRFANPPDGGQITNYRESRDLILTRLSDAFPDRSGQFLSFIGYPPVLDSIATLLRGERNYHKLTMEMSDSSGPPTQKGLLRRIAEYILERERVEKVLPNLVRPIASELPTEESIGVEDAAYSVEEQCARLVANSLGERLEIRVFERAAINARYEDGLSSFLQEHPFADGRAFRNALFEAMCTAVLIASAKDDYVELVNRYVLGKRSNYHVVYLLDQIAGVRRLPSESLHILVGSALELRPANMGSEIIIEPSSEFTEQVSGGTTDAVPISISLEVYRSDSDGDKRVFRFESEVIRSSTVLLGDRLQSCYVDLPCGVLLAGDEVELTAPVEISAAAIELRAVCLVAKAKGGAGDCDRAVVLEAGSLSTGLTSVSVEGADLTVSLTESTGLGFPLVKYVRRREGDQFIGQLREPYLKLRKILTHFRSHSRGALAKYRDKVDNPRVAGNPVGGKVLRRLLADGILFASGNFYYLRPENVDKFLGIPWTALRAGLVCDKLEDYLARVLETS